jgi:hypothetical protein
MHHVPSSGSGKTNNHMLFRSIEVQLALNLHAGYNLMSVIAGLPYFDNYLYSQKLPFLYSSIHHDMFFMPTGDWTLVKIRCRLFMSCHDLPALKIRGGRELPVTDQAAEQRLAIRLYHFELSRWKSVHTSYFTIWVFEGPNIEVSQNVVRSGLEEFWI